MNEWMDGWMDGRMVAYKRNDGWMDKLVRDSYGWMEGWIDIGKMDRWIDGSMNPWVDKGMK